MQIRDNNGVRDLGPAVGGVTSYAWKFRQDREIKRIIDKTKNMTPSRLEKYLNGVLKKRLGIRNFNKLRGIKLGTTAKPKEKKFSYLHNLKPVQQEDAKKLAWQRWNKGRSEKLSFGEWQKTFDI